MNLLPKYIKYKIASELSASDLYNLHLTSNENYQLYRSNAFWAHKLNMTTSDWQNRVNRSGDLYGGYPTTKHYFDVKNVYRYRTLGLVASCLDVFGNL